MTFVRGGWLFSATWSRIPKKFWGGKSSHKRSFILGLLACVHMDTANGCLGDPGSQTVEDALWHRGTPVVILIRRLHDARVSSILLANPSDLSFALANRLVHCRLPVKLRHNLH